MTIMVYVYCPLTVVASHHFLPSCTQIGLTLNEVRSFPAKKAYKAISSTLQKYLRAFFFFFFFFLGGGGGGGEERGAEGGALWGGGRRGCPVESFFYFKVSCSLIAHMVC